MRLSRDGGVDDIVFVFFFVFKDHHMIVDNYYRVVISPLFVIRCAKYRLLGRLTCLGPCYLIFTTKSVPLGPRNQHALFSWCSWFLVEPVVFLVFLPPTRLAIPVGLEYF